MVEVGIRALYTIVLLTITVFCLREAWLVWFDRTLQIGHFVATKDGADVASMGDSFRRLVVQQQNVLFDLYKGTDSRPGEFRVSTGDVLTIHLDDLVRMPGSALDSLKIEAAGVNVTSLLTTLRRWIVAPNEITGSVDQIGSQVIVSADWANLPHARGTRTAWQMLVLPRQTTLQAASFDLACRVLFARIPPDHAWLKDVSENDFCIFSTALSRFRNYLTARNVAVNEADTKAANEELQGAQQMIDRLVAAKTNLIFAYKLGGYIELERVASITNPDANAIKPQLDKAQALLGDYMKRFAALDPAANDADVQEKLASLVARGGAIQTAENLRKVDASTFLKTFSPVLNDTTKVSQVAPAHRAALRPGMSIGPADGKTAATSGIFVVRDDKKYLLTSSVFFGRVGSAVVSPSLLDTAQNRREIGKVAEIDGAFALIELSVDASNEQIKQVAPSPPLGAEVRLLGRGTGLSKSVVSGFSITVSLETERGPLTLKDLFATADPMGLPGDGGGAVLDEQDGVIGLLIGGSLTMSLVLPVADFLDRQQLKLLR
jgi:hypothetical protein